jgi:hypothetical protein
MRDHLGVADELRPSDADRERVVRDLTKHCGDGRLTLDELEERIAEAYAAATVADLEHAVRELPRSMPARVAPSAPAVKRSAAPVRTSTSTGAEIALKVHLAVYLSVIAFLVLIWFLTSPFGYFWPIWPAMSWGLAVVIQAAVTKAVGRQDGSD